MRARTRITPNLAAKTGRARAGQIHRATAGEGRKSEPHHFACAASSAVLKTPHRRARAFRHPAGYLQLHSQELLLEPFVLTQPKQRTAASTHPLVSCRELFEAAGFVPLLLVQYLCLPRQPCGLNIPVLVSQEKSKPSAEWSQEKVPRHSQLCLQLYHLLYTLFSSLLSLLGCVGDCPTALPTAWLQCWWARQGTGNPSNPPMGTTTCFTGSEERDSLVIRGKKNNKTHSDPLRKCNKLWCKMTRE